MTNCAVIPVNILTGLDAVEKKIVWGAIIATQVHFHISEK